jgi:NADH-quinone oxidoreductase subunit M
MILVWLIVIPLAGGLIGWVLDGGAARRARWIAAATMIAELALALWLWARYYGAAVSAGAPWLVEFRRAWIPSLGISFQLGIDTLSLLLIVLTAFLGVLAVICSWTEIESRSGFFHFNLLWVLAGLVGVFSALDLFLFYFFWELMLVPMYFLIAIWGHERRIYASMKFFIFTQLSGLLMLVAILGLYFIHGNNTGNYTFDYRELLGTVLPAGTAMWLMLGFLIAFLVKLPAIPVHTWLPDAHTEAPTAGSVVLAGLLLKTGAYGLLRFVLPLFPQAAAAFGTVAMFLGAAGILYGALLAFGQGDLKRLVAYSSVSHMGFVLLGVFAWNELALQGAVIQMLCHGISTGALFILVGALQERTHTREMERLGGLWAVAPRMGGVAMLFALASLGLPGLGNFIGEFLILLGVYQVNAAAAAVAAVGLISGTIYSLWMVQRTFHGEMRREERIADLSWREMAMFASLIAAIVWIGFYPQPLLSTAKPALDRLEPPAAVEQAKK